MASDALDSWEELEDSDILDKKLEGITLSNQKEKEELGSETPMFLTEEGNRTQYQPQVRILKRKTENRPDNQLNSSKGNKPTKTLEQREAEYREARERILGSNYKSEETPSPVTSPTPLTENRPVRLVQNSPEDNSVKVVRDPKGPDGTNGFGKPR